MFMPKLGTMHPRNSLFTRILTGIVFVVMAGLLFSGPGLTQTSSSQTPSTQPPAPQSAQGSAHPDQPAPSSPAAPAQTSPSGQVPASQPGSSAGESPSSTDNGVFVFRKEVDEVTLHATVVDERNRLITNLDRASFTVFENNLPQQIKSFRHEDYPVAMGIVIDNSGSMREKRDQVNKAELNLVRY